MRATSRVALAAASCASALVAACTFESLSGLTGGQPQGDAAPPDASESEMPVDATSEPPEPDAPANMGADAGRDAAPDARVDGPSPEAGPWCQSHTHYFCSDWDEGSLNAQWTSIYTVGEGGVGLATDASTSPPASFVAAVPALPSGATSHQALTHKFPVTATSLDVSFDLLIDALDTSAATQPTETLAIVFDGTSNPYSLQLNLVLGDTQLGQQAPSADGGHSYDGWPFSMQPPMGVWTHYVIHVDLSSTPSASVWMNDAGVVNHALSGYVPGTVTLQVGVCYTPGATTGTRVPYDNVTLDYQ